MNKYGVLQNIYVYKGKLCHTDTQIEDYFSFLIMICIRSVCFVVWFSCHTCTIESDQLNYPEIDTQSINVNVRIFLHLQALLSCSNVHVGGLSNAQIQPEDRDNIFKMLHD